MEISKMCSSLFVFIIFFAVGCVCNNPHNDNVPFFIFGDSIVETGNNNYLETHPIAQSNYWPYGQSFFKFPTGRWSDGRTVPDFIAEFANVRLVRPYLYPGKKHYSDGINFASGGAGALDELNRALGIINMKTQLRYFKKVKRDLEKQLGKTEAEAVLSRAVYLFSIGTNDYRTFTQDPKLFNSYSTEEYVDVVLGNITSIIKKIHKAGGRKFAVINLNHFSNLPAVEELVASEGEGARVEQLDQLAELHNMQLYQELQNYTTTLKGFRYSYIDFYVAFDEIRNNPAKYGMKEVRIACCGSGKFRGNMGCGGKGEIKEYEVCENPDEHLFYDFSHGTDRGNRIVAEMIWNGDSNSSRPVNVKSLFHS